MAEAVFTLAADITPQINDKLLQQQAKALSTQLNNLLAQNSPQVAVKGNFNEFTKQVADAAKNTNLFTKAFDTVKKTATEVGSVGKKAFGGFLEAIQVTRKDVVGFSDSLFDTIRNTTRFRDSLDKVKEAGGTIGDLPQRFEVLAAQIDSGNSALDRAAKAGDAFSQALLPVTRISEATRTDTSELVSVIKALSENISDMGSNAGKTGIQLKDSFNPTQFEKARNSFVGIKGLFGDIGPLANKFSNSVSKIDSQGNLKAVVTELQNIRTDAQKITGPLGFIGSLFSEDTKAARETAKEIQLGVNKQLVALGQGNTLGNIEKLKVRFSNVSDNVKQASATFQSFLGIVAKAVPGQFFDDFTTFFKTSIKQDGVSSFNALKTSIVAAFSLTSTGGFFNDILARFSGMKAAGLGVAQSIGATFGEAFKSVSNELDRNFNSVKTVLFGLAATAQDVGSKIASFFSSGASKISDAFSTIAARAKSAVSNIGSGGSAAGAAASGAASSASSTATATIKPPNIDAKAIGADLVRGFKSGIDGAQGEVTGILGRFAQTVLNTLKTFFEIASPSKATERMGADLDRGLANGIRNNTGVISGAVNALVAPLRGIANVVGSVAKTGFTELAAAAKVAGTALAGIAGAAIITGANFNVLKQVISSTLPVIVGSKQVSDQLLASVNALNDTSPFSRQTFLELTRVLAGFGVQAAKITPLIDSIQQAVAATGGSDADINELGQAFARLQSQGRLSLDIIQSFSSRGIDVISLLGQQFGKTQGQIRDMISNGLIPANQAIDALTKGLKDKFNGATDAVAKNFPGALQRVQARLRDIGGDLDKAFINPAGGGALVDLLNNLAVALAAFRNNILPLVAGPLQKFADGLSTVSKSVSDTVKAFSDAFGSGVIQGGIEKSFNADGITSFANSIKGLLVPAVALLVSTLPNLLTIIPVVGPLFEGFAAAIGGLPLVLTVLALSMKPVREAIVALGAAFIPVFREVLPLASEAFKKLSDAVGPILGAVIRAFIPLVGFLGEALKQAFKAINPILDAAKGLFNALKPLAFLIPVIFVAFTPFIAQILLAVGALRLFSPIIVVIINILTALVNKIAPVIIAFKDFVVNAAKSETVKQIFQGISEFIQKVGDDIQKAFGFIEDRINDVIKIYNRLPSFLRGGGKISLIGEDKASPAIKSVTENTKALQKAQKEAADAAGKNAAKLADDYKAAAKAAEDANATVSNLTDQLTQALSSTDQKLQGVLDAGQAVKTAQQAQKDAATAAAKAQTDLNQALRDQSKALRDVISPARELQKAQADLAKTAHDLVINDRERADVLKEIADLQGQIADDKRAELDRNITRAQIALNKAKQDELDLTKQSNAANDTSVNLAGLSLDQIKSKLANTRLSLQAQKQSNDAATAGGKTQQQIDDEKKSAQLDVADAEANLKKSQQERQQFELDTTRQIADDQFKIVDLQNQKLDLQDQQVLQQNHIIDLQKGETTQAQVIKDFQEKIKAARDANTKAQTAVTAAVKATALAEADLQLKSAALRGDAEAQATAQEKIWALKKQGVTFDAATEQSLKNQLGTINTIVAQLNAAQSAAQKASAEAQRAAIAQLGGFGTQEDAVRKQIASGPFDPKLTKVVTDLAANVNAALVTINTGGQILDKNNQARVLTPDQFNEILAGISDEQAFNPNKSFHDILVEILAKIGLHIPGFATGYAPGTDQLVHMGMNNGVGLARMFEFGKEAVLPLTNAMRMRQVVNNPNVLPEILQALPTITLPTANNTAVAPMVEVSRSGGFSASSTNASGQPMTHQDRRREQMQMASDIGDAVKEAVTAALKENPINADVDINMAPQTNNEAVIAREVARQVKKALNQW